MNTGLQIKNFIQLKTAEIIKNVNDFNEGEVHLLYTDLLNQIDYRISNRESMPTILNETMIVINKSKGVKVSDQTYLKFASALIDVGENSGYDSVELLYSLVENVLEGE